MSSKDSEGFFGDQEDPDFEQWEDTGEPQQQIDQTSITRTTPYRPVNRPPIAVLVAFDDGCSTGEAIRIREDFFTLGREGASFNIIHDEAISPIHAAIRRKRSENGFRWEITDLNSESGLFVRVKRTRLRDQSQFLAGRSIFSFREGVYSERTSHSSLENRLRDGSIPNSHVPAENAAYPSITCKSPDEDDKILWLIDGCYWIGRSTECSFSVVDDTCLAAKHIEVFRENGSWQARTHGVPNGMWIRLANISVKNTCTFQIGEQRFRLYTDLPKAL